VLFCCISDSIILVLYYDSSVDGVFADGTLKSQRCMSYRYRKSPAGARDMSSVRRIDRLHVWFVGMQNIVSVATCPFITKINNRSRFIQNQMRLMHVIRTVIDAADSAPRLKFHRGAQ